MLGRVNTSIGVMSGLIDLGVELFAWEGVLCDGIKNLFRGSMPSVNERYQMGKTETDHNVMGCYV